MDSINLKCQKKHHLFNIYVSVYEDCIDMQRFTAAVSTDVTLQPRYTGSCRKRLSA